MMRSVLAGIGLLALTAAVPASAADLPPRGPMPYKAPGYVMGFNWTGFYIGLHAGYGWGNSGGGADLEGGFVGGQVGYNWQAAGSPWIFGAELDSAWADFGRTDTFAAGALLVTAKTEADYMGSFRGRIGYAVWDRTMVYATGGLAWMNNEVSVTATTGAFTVGISESKTHIGGTIGAGVEHAFAPNLSGRVEYRYTSYGSETYFASLGGLSLDADSHTVNVGLNYRFR
jgi:outer membrane immunogenic protein